MTTVLQSLIYTDTRTLTALTTTARIMDGQVPRVLDFQHLLEQVVTLGYIVGLKGTAIIMAVLTIWGLFTLYLSEV